MKTEDFTVRAAPSTASPPAVPVLRVISGWRWVMVGFAFFATTINYLDRQVLSVVAASPDFKAAVPLTEEAYGYVTLAFLLAYAVSNGLSGPFIDWVGTRIGYGCCMLWWSVAGMLHVFARGALTCRGCGSQDSLARILPGKPVFRIFVF